MKAAEWIGAIVACVFALIIGMGIGNALIPIDGEKCKPLMEQSYARGFRDGYMEWLTAQTTPPPFVDEGE